MSNFIKSMFGGNDTDGDTKSRQHKRNRRGYDGVRFIDHRSKMSIKSEFNLAVHQLSTFKETLKSFIKDKNYSEFQSLTPAQQKTFLYVYNKVKSTNSFLRFLLVQVNKACNESRSDSAEAVEMYDKENEGSDD